MRLSEMRDLLSHQWVRRKNASDHTKSSIKQLGCGTELSGIQPPKSFFDSAEGLLIELVIRELAR